MIRINLMYTNVSPQRRYDGSEAASVIETIIENVFWKYNLMYEQKNPCI